LLIPLLSGDQPGGAMDPWTPPTPTQTATARPTTPPPIALPTATQAAPPTATPEPTPEPVTPTPEPSPTAAIISAEVTADGVNLRSAPGTNAGIVGTANQGDRFTVTGRSADGNWLQVCCVSDQPAWLSGSYVNLSSPADALPVIP
jgi:hypothetical protein